MLAVIFRRDRVRCHPYVTRFRGINAKVCGKVAIHHISKPFWFLFSFLFFFFFFLLLSTFIYPY